jgi:hypothetical protein
VVDVTAPTISLNAPLDGAVYLLDEEVLADYECADEPLGSGLASCAGDVPDGEAIDTSSVGAHEFTVEAADAAGNSASAASAYRVIYDFDFRWPVRDRPAVNLSRAGRVALVRFSLNGFHGRQVVAAGYPQVAEVECDSGAEPAEGERARLVRSRKGIRWGRWSKTYALLWKTQRSWAGTCRQFLLGLRDGTVHRADYRFIAKH